MDIWNIGLMMFVWLSTEKSNLHVKQMAAIKSVMADNTKDDVWIMESNFFMTFLFNIVIIEWRRFPVLMLSKYGIIF